jgi:hypothetical protein
MVDLERHATDMSITDFNYREIGTLNDFRDFFGMERHKTFESITRHKDVQDALRDLYDHPDKVELYPGVFCESDGNMGADPGPSDVDSALWAAIFSDAITLVRSDRFYTVVSPVLSPSCCHSTHQTRTGTPTR